MYLVSSTPTSPVVSQRLLRAELRKLRRATGRSATDVADALGWDPSRLTRLETTAQAPKRLVVTALLDELDVHGEPRTRILTLVDLARGHGWWDPYRSSLSTGFLTYLGHEDAADLIHLYEPDTLPGLLQTEDYTRALVATRHPHLDGQTIEELVAVRASRQLRLQGTAPVRLWAVLGEAALRYQVGGKDVMRAQLDHLLAMAQTRHVTVSIARFDQGAPIAKGPFTILTFVEAIPDVAYLENAGRDQWLDREEDVAVHRETWERMLAAGTKYDATIDTIKDAIAALA